LWWNKTEAVREVARQPAVAVVTRVVDVPVHEGGVMLPNVGDRIEIDFIDDPGFPRTLFKGARGTVQRITHSRYDNIFDIGTCTQIWVKWDKQGNVVALIPELGDKFHLIEKEK
jgi:hypothetical protein